MPQAKSALAAPKLPPQTQGDAEEEREDYQLQRDLQMIEERTKADKISRLLQSKAYLIDAGPTHVIPRAELEARAAKDPKFLEGLPKVRFSRFYLKERIVVDLFVTEKAYKEADVEARRAWCRSEGVRYGALGPTMNTIDLTPQLEEPAKAKEQEKKQEQAARAKPAVKGKARRK